MMGDVTLIQISDPHLSRARPFFLGNWRRLVAELERVRPDAIVVSGDLSVDGAGADDDLAFAASEIAQLPAALVKVIAGNHDIGEASPDNPAGETIDDARRTRFQRHFGAEWWEEELGSWVLIGINSMLPGSGLAAEREQEDWLEAAIERAADRPIGLFLHKPLFIDRPDEPEMIERAVPSRARSILLGFVEPWLPLRILARATGGAPHITETQAGDGRRWAADELVRTIMVKNP